MLLGKLLIDLKTITNCVNNELKMHNHRTYLASSQKISIETEMQTVWLLFVSEEHGNFTRISYKMYNHYSLIVPCDTQECDYWV